MVGLLLLKHMFGLSDEGVCQRWVYDPYFQFFTGEAFFQHRFPHERSGLNHWRKRLGDGPEVLLTERLRAARDTGALKPKDVTRVIVDTTSSPRPGRSPKPRSRRPMSTKTIVGTTSAATASGSTCRDRSAVSTAPLNACCAAARRSKW